MKKSIFCKLTFLLFLMPLLISCGTSDNKKEDMPTNANQTNESPNSLVTHDYFETNPSNIFILSDMELLSATNKLDHTEPQVAANNPCEHIGGGLQAQGVHLTFNRQAISGGYLVEVLAPADGKVDRVDTCTDTCNKDGCTGNTQYSIVLEIAKHKEDGKAIYLQYSFEPIIKNSTCSLPDTLEGVEANSTYADLIYVKRNEFVKKGDSIAHLWIPEDPNYTLAN